MPSWSAPWDRNPNGPRPDLPGLGSAVISIVTLVKTKIKDPKQAFGMAVTFKIKAGSEKEFEAAFAPCVKATRKESGCILYTFNRDVDEVGTYVVYEQFKNIAGLEAHAKTKHVEEFLKKAAPMFDGDPKAKVFAILAE